MSDFIERLRYGASEVGAILPAVIAAVVLLVVGYFLARQVQRWVARVLKRMNFNRMAEAGGLTEVVERAEPNLSPALAVGKLVFWLVMLVVILLASTALGLESINEMFGAMLTFIPTLIAGIVIMLLGLIVGEFVRGLILASAGGVGLGGVTTLARVAKGMVILIALFMALEQVGVAGEIVTAAFTLILGAVALAVGIAFGLGNRDLAGEVTRRWYEEGRARDEAARRTSKEEPPPAA